MRRLLCAFLLLACPALACPATPPAIEVLVEVGWGNFVKDGRWNPVFVTITNRGPRRRVRLDLHVPVSANEFSHYVRDLELASPARRLAVLYFHATAYCGEMKLEVLDREPTTPTTEARQVPPLVRRTLTPELVGASQPLIVELSESRAGQSQLLTGRQIASAQVVFLNPRHWPDRWFGFDGLDALVLSDYPARKPRLEDWQTVERWIRLGGRLVVLGGESAAQLRDSPVAPLLPVELSGQVRVVDVKGSKWARQEKLGGSLIVAEFSRRQGAFAFNHGLNLDLPRHYLQTVGEGDVTFVPFSDLRPPIAGSRSWQSLFVAITARFFYYFPRGLRLLDDSSFWLTRRQVVANVPALQLPTRATIALALLVYVILLGPAHWCWSRRSRRLTAGVTFPAMIALFTLVTYTQGRKLKGTQPFVNEVSIAFADSAETSAHVQSLIGIVSPDDQDYSLTATDANTVITRPPATWGATPIGLGTRPATGPAPNPGQFRFPFSRRWADPEPVTHYLLSDRLTLENFRIKWGAMELVRAESVLPLAGGIVGSVSPRVGAERASGSVENRSALEVEDVWIVPGMNRPVFRAQRLLPGEKLEFSRMEQFSWQEYLRLGPLRVEGSKADLSARASGLIRERAFSYPFALFGPTLIAHLRNPQPLVTLRPGESEYRSTHLIVVRLERSAAR